MEIIKIILNFIILLSSIPVGLLLAKLCGDEIVYRKWFFVILYASIIILVVFLLVYADINIILSLIYMIIITIISIWKGKDKK